MKTITILGSTGSIGSQALKIIKDNHDQFSIDCLYANSNYKILYQQIKDFSPNYVCINNEQSYKQFLYVFLSKFCPPSVSQVMSKGERLTRSSQFGSRVLEKEREGFGWVGARVGGVGAPEQQDHTRRRGVFPKASLGVTKERQQLVSHERGDLLPRRQAFQHPLT